MGVAILCSVALGLIAFGVWRGHPLALELLPSISLLGIIVAGVLAAGCVGCGSWLVPNLSGCEAFSPLRLGPPLIGIAAFGLSLWLMPHLPRRQTT